MLYPEMNAKIVALLRVSDQPAHLYAADRIEQLEQKGLALADLVLEWEALERVDFYKYFKLTKRMIAAAIELKKIAGGR